MRRHFSSRLRVLVASAFVLGAALAIYIPRGGEGPDVDEALRDALADRRVHPLRAEPVLWLGEPTGSLGLRETVFLAEGASGDVDLWHAWVRHSHGTVFQVPMVTNVSRSAAAREEQLVRLGSHAAYLTEVDGKTNALTLVDLRGEPASITEDWPRSSRIQNAITNLQTQGRARGFGRRRYALRRPVEGARLSVSGEELVLRFRGGVLRIDPNQEEPTLGGDGIDVVLAEKGQPGGITWLVDTVRRVSFVGPEPIAWLEHRVFGAVDTFRRVTYPYLGHRTGAAEAVQDMGVTVGPSEASRAALTVRDPQRGWPPPPIAKVVESADEAEGHWVVDADDPFIGGYPNAPPPFVQTQLRVDPARPYARVYVVAWDPRQVQLRMMSGTREPESATGATAPGIISRDKEVLTRLVGAFNGGFQSMHGEFGMMSDGVVYLPPKPWAATVGVFRDGRVVMGSWLGLPRRRSYTERFAISQIPDGMFEMRQNLTSVVEGDRYNPWHRWWWGAAPLNAEEQVFVDRSGLCLTEEGYMMYFWGRSMGADQLGEAMLAARCIRGMHLDMNVAHTAFEFYNVRREADAFPALGRPLEEWEFEGTAPQAPDLLVRSRLAVRRMEPMRFPRYVARDPRDFMYLLLRPTLPGPDVEVPGHPGAGHFETQGLPHAGFPLAFARTHLGGEPGSQVWLVRIDPSRAVPEPVMRADRPPTQGPNVLAYLTHAREGLSGMSFGIYAQRDTIGWRYAVGMPPRGEGQMVVAGPWLADVPNADAAMGVDSDGFLVYAERQPSATIGLSEAMARAGVTRAIALRAETRLAFVAEGETISPDEFAREVDPELALSLLAQERPYAEVLFPDVEPMPYYRWGSIQDTRVRYIREEDHEFRHSRSEYPE